MTRQFRPHPDDHVVPDVEVKGRRMWLLIYGEPSGIIKTLTPEMARELANRLVEAACVCESHPMSGAEAVAEVTGTRGVQ